jgi:nicotinate phosphoribosyltransferase
VWRGYGADGRMRGDILAREGYDKDGEPLLQLVMHNGKRVHPPEALDTIKARARRELERLPEPLRQLQPDATYPVEIAPELVALAAEVDRRQQFGAPARKNT